MATSGITTILRNELKKMSHEELVVRQGIMVVGVDGSPSSMAAFHWAGKNALALNLRIKAICAWNTINFAAEMISIGFGSSGFTDMTNPEEIAKKILEASTGEVFATSRPLDLELISSEGNPTEVLLEASKGAQMLVLGSRGHGSLVDLILGSVSDACCAKAKCPVLVVHEGIYA